MYAIIRAGGKQAKVRLGDVIDIDRLKGAGETLEFVPLLVVGEDGSTISDRTTLAGSRVVAKVLGESSGPKIDIFKYQNKTGYRRSAGHRQKYTAVEVTAINLPQKAPKGGSEKQVDEATEES